MEAVAHDDRRALILIAIGVRIVGVFIMARMAREVTRIGRAVAGLVSQGEEGTRTRRDELLRGPLPRPPNRWISAGHRPNQGWLGTSDALVTFAREAERRNVESLG